MDIHAQTVDLWIFHKLWKLCLFSPFPGKVSRGVGKDQSAVSLFVYTHFFCFNFVSNTMYCFCKFNQVFQSWEGRNQTKTHAGYMCL